MEGLWKIREKQILMKKEFTNCSVADPGCRIPDPDPNNFSSRIQTFFHPGSYMKSGMQTYCFLAFLVAGAKP
jgi:hypothetical protein